MVAKAETNVMRIVDQYDNRALAAHGRDSDASEAWLGHRGQRSTPQGHAHGLLLHYLTTRKAI
jgi:hypothetical protein